MTAPNEPSQDDRPNSGDFGQNPISGPVAMLPEKVNKQAVQIMIIIVMGLSEDAERGMQFSNQLYGPDLIHPKIVKGRANSD